MAEGISVRDVAHLKKKIMKKDIFKYIAWMYGCRVVDSKWVDFEGGMLPTGLPSIVNRRGVAGAVL